MFLQFKNLHGKVERSGLNPYYRNFEITSNCWRTTDQKNVGKPTKKETLNPKTKKLQWDGMRRSNKIKSLHQLVANPQSVKYIYYWSSPIGVESPGVINQASQPAGLAMEEEIPRTWRQIFSDLTVLGETNSTFKGNTGSHAYQETGEEIMTS